MLKTIVVFHLTVVCSVGASAAESPLVIENPHLLLRFDAGTGAWTGLVDKHAGDDLVVAGAAPVSVAPAPPPVLDSAQVARAITAGQALDLAGEWFYTPTPPKTEATADFLQGRFAAVPWVSTPVPSRRGAGDDRLHDRVGDFWYRREFQVPALWQDEELALVLGAVDDFDEAWLNGERIGRTGSETPQAWKTPRIYRFAARQLRRDGPNVLLLKVTNGAFDGGIDGPVALGTAAHLLVKPPVAPPLTRHDVTREDGATILRMTAPDGDYEYQAEFALPDDRAAFTRRLSVKNRSADEQVFQTMFYVTPPLSVGADTAVIFPGSLPVGDTALLSLADGTSVRPRSSEPLALLWSESQQRGVGAWFFCEEEYAPVSVRRAGAGASVGHRQDVIDPPAAWRVDYVGPAVFLVGAWYARWGAERRPGGVSRRGPAGPGRIAGRTARHDAVLRPSGRTAGARFPPLWRVPGLDELRPHARADAH